MITLNKFIFLFIFSSLAHAQWQCVTGQIKFTYLKEVKIENTRYCYNKEKTSLLSDKCFRKKCTLEKISKIKVDQQLNSVIGSPPFKYCRMLSGSPQILKFKADNKWWSLDRCIFEDGEYIDTGYLYGAYLKRKKKKESQRPSWIKK